MYDDDPRLIDLGFCSGSSTEKYLFLNVLINVMTISMNLWNIWVKLVSLL